MKLSDQDIQSIVKTACTEAIGFIESDIAPVRNKCQRYMDGEVDIGWDEGTSKVVATKVRDIVRIIIPNLLRVFLASEKPVEYVPKTPEQVDMAKDATDYLWAEFRRMDGFQTLYDAIRDAVTKKTGFIKCYWEDVDHVETHKYSNVSDEELALLQDEPGVEVTEIKSEDMPLPEELVIPEGMPVPQVHSITLERTTTTGKLSAEVIAPEDFFINEGATSLKDALVYGTQSNMRVADLVEMGVDFDKAKSLGTINEDDTGEKYERASHHDDDQEATDPAMKEVTVTECFMRIDTEGTGKACWMRFLCGGSRYEILDSEKWSGSCIAVFEVDPEPHLFFGKCPPEQLFEDQDAATSMLRGGLNNVALVNTPRSEVNDQYVNMDDYLNNEIGSVVRVTQMGQINEFTTPPIAQYILPMMQYHDGIVEAKAGVNNLSAGLNPELLQNQTATAVNATVQAGANQIEAIARHLAEGGMVSLFRIMLELIIENAPEEVFLRNENGEFRAIHPTSWDLDMDVHINVGLGATGDVEKSAALSGLLQLQKEAMAGAQVTGMTPMHIRNTVTDVLRMSGVYDVDRYWPVPPPPPAPQPPVDPAQGLIAIEREKNAGRLQEKILELQAKMIELDAKDDLERDQMAQELWTDFAQIMGEYNVKIDTAQIQAIQNMAREHIFQNGLNTVA